MTRAGPAIEVRHNESAHRFEAFVDGQLARADYRLAGSRIVSRRGVGFR